MRSEKLPAESRETRETHRVACRERRLLAGVRSAGAVGNEALFDPSALSLLIDQLADGEGIEVRYGISAASATLSMSVDVEGLASMAEEAEKRTAILSNLLDASLDLACPHLHFLSDTSRDNDTSPIGHVQETRPAWWVWHPADGRSRHPRIDTPELLVVPDGLAAGDADAKPLIAAEQRAVLFDAPPSKVRLPADSLANVLRRLSQPYQVVLRFENVVLTPRDRRTLRAVAVRLAYAPHRLSRGLQSTVGDLVDEEELLHRVNAWLARGRGSRCRCFLTSPWPARADHTDMIGHLVFGRTVAARARREPDDALDLRGATPGSVPAIYPFPAAPLSFGLPRTAPPPTGLVPCDGVRVGRTDDGQPWHLAKADRARHTYVIGATGTGKSTLLLNMIRQDMAAGESVVVIDPHGDLFADARRAVPAHRESDVVVVDFADFRHPVAVNLLEIRGEHREIAQNFICNELMRIFTRVLYRGVPEAFGPMFEAYFRNSLLLLMQGGGGEVTLVDLERVFADDAFRERLLTNCGEGHVTRFWRGIAGRVTHQDHSLMNMAPYIVSKVTQFTSNALIRPIISQPRSTVDFRGMLDDQKIILVNLAKGLLGELDSALLGMLVLGKIYLAALGRANVARDRRKPANLFIDEFQNIATESLGAMMSEGRKFGLCVTLANQTLSQIDGRDLATNLAGPILANAANLIVFRVGVPDAEMLACWTRPAIDKDMLAQLPDFHAAARILHRGRPLSPFVFASDPAP